MPARGRRPRDEAARHRPRPPGGARRTGAGGGARRRRRVDDRAEPRCRRRAAVVLAQRRDGRHRLRAPRPRPRDGRALGCPYRARRPPAARLPGAVELAADGVRTGGDRRNREFAGPHVESTAEPELEALAYDPQTSGGLLVTLPSDKRAVLEATFAAAGLPLHHVGARRGRGRGDAVVRLARACASRCRPRRFLQLAVGAVSSWASSSRRGRSSG